VSAAGDPDRVEITTVGIDVGSATHHLTFSRVRLERRARQLSTRFDVVGRDLLWASPIALTPYADGGDTIDADAVAATVAAGFASARLAPGDIDSGAVLLTGTALARHNARALADRLAGTSGRFVCASAGHHLEAVLAAHGSGAVEASRHGPPVVSLDVGGGTAKLALAASGRVLATAAVAAGARLVAWDGAGRLVRIEETVRPVAAGLGIDLQLATVLPADAVRALSARLAQAIVAQLQPPASRPAAGDLLVTDAFPPIEDDVTIVVSGGVAEYLDVPGEHPGTGDLGPHLAVALRRSLVAAGLETRRRPARQRIRATAIGASQYSTQVSGSTVRIGDESLLPLHGVPVLRLELGPDDDAAAVASAVRRVAAERPEAVRPGAPVAVGITWQGTPEHRRLHAVAAGIRAAGGDALAGVHPIIVTVDRDLAASLGRVMVEEAGMEGPSVLCLDNLELGDLDHLDIGRPRPPAGVVPVVVTSLLFDLTPAAGAPGPPPPGATHP
jgi:ethanolamine utilization protein EutA